ncbi:hypothetical protein DID88_008436 [Monilinia fructigena]|uniref:Uncharacterized protein n=1 Tax=Monilinia fructigena TaxID=38457 RepID=A0A395J5A5_9HELO|nr:hypothetical protein DID88_008436 [Monilinia fructigena]
MAKSNGSMTPGSLGASGPSVMGSAPVGTFSPSVSASGASTMINPPGVLRTPEARKWNTEIPKYLPHEKVFPIQIGTECFSVEWGEFEFRWYRALILFPILSMSIETSRRKW